MQKNTKRYNVYLETGERKLNHIEINNGELTRILQAFENGVKEYFLDGKTNYINENSKIQIFEFEESSIGFFYNVIHHDKYQHNIEGNKYFPLDILSRHGRNITNKVLSGKFGHKNPIYATQQIFDNHITSLSNGSLSHLHPKVIKVAAKLFKDGHYRSAILDTYIALTEDIKKKSGRNDLDGTPLMQTVFSEKNPLLRISDDSDEQRGFMWLFSGAVMGIRNPKAHRLIEQTDPKKTLEWLSFASALFKVLDEAILELKIISAKYHGLDCTEILNSKIVQGKLPQTEVDCIIKPDPAYGIQKKLEVKYQYQGKILSKVVFDGHTLELP